MELEYRTDFEDVLRRWDAFWDGTNKRPMLYAVRPAAGKDPEPLPPWYEQPFGDLDDIAERTRRWGETHEFLADAVPGARICFGPDHLALLLGGNLEQNPDSPATTWVQPCVNDWQRDDIAFRPESRWWERTVEAIRAFRSRCDGRMLVYAPALPGGLDALAALRGPQRLLMDLVDSPDEVQSALQAVHAAWRDVQAAFAAELGRDGTCDMNRFGMLTRGPIDVPQCDFGAMIGPDMFDAFQRPSLERETAWLDHSIYHLDGPENIRHLESVCSVADLDMIQWMPGAGHMEEDGSDLYDRIDALGKGQIFQDFVPWSQSEQAVVDTWRRLRSRKLYFRVGERVVGDIGRLVERLEATDRYCQKLNGKHENGEPVNENGDANGVARGFSVA